jgi:hypothetical protein
MMTKSFLKKKFRQLERAGERPTLIHAEIVGEKVLRAEIRSEDRTLFSTPKGFRARLEDSDIPGGRWTNPMKGGCAYDKASEHGFVV